ncbi:hypothetical protein [Mesorhizobium sp.]|uniref:hypothetical protein n=1 Tax=Mesorhizobium sp. TaxID=1871066 RepID=UPI001202BC9F|nr:hypothetical protein [Mesorhizobium sp.]TIL24865.1 MAG: hypothetical protein E5Y85_35350 [Mesorhizobium sp.]
MTAGSFFELRLLSGLAATFHIAFALAAIGNTKHMVRLSGAPRPALAALKVATGLHLGEKFQGGVKPLVPAISDL